MDPASPELLDTAHGPIEVARRGAGPPVLLVHGSPGGSDSSLAMGRFLVDAGFELIAPSRPGYLTTPLEGRESIDAQADLLAALLDALGHERAGVVTWSGGGPSGYRLAVRHPERVSALVAFAAVSHDWHVDEDDLESELMMKTRPGNWALRFLADHAPKSAIAATLKAEGDLTKQELKALVDEVVGDDAQRDVVLTMVHVVGDYGHRRVGMDNDFAQFAGIETLELERIGAPTLIVNGDADTDVVPEYSDHAAATIPGAQRLVMARGTHLCLFAHPDATTAQARVVEHLRQS
jgi:pimeloyl-ACP methyl ester carboxylesterase